METALSLKLVEYYKNMKRVKMDFNLISELRQSFPNIFCIFSESFESVDQVP